MVRWFRVVLSRTTQVVTLSQLRIAVASTVAMLPSTDALRRDEPTPTVSWRSTSRSARHRRSGLIVSVPSVCVARTGYPAMIPVHSNPTTDP